eukprot:snap_masked-scaffold_91-processed-gene-0.17-mRNA-1 protein AED:1.00 eAED:1.00 QI:0/0/0/0/1/1/2/0/448
MNPPYSCSSRTATCETCSASLVATMIGAGVLTLPYAFSQSGVLLSCLLLTLSSFLNYGTNLLLVKSSIKSQSSTMTDLVEKSLGSGGKHLNNFLLFSLTFFGQVGYGSLIRDLATSLAESYIFSPSAFGENLYLQNEITIFLITLTFDSLKYSSYASVISVIILAFVVLFKLIQKYIFTFESPTLQSVQSFDTAIAPSFYSLDPHDFLFTFPFMQLSFYCHINTLTTFTELRDPSIERKKIVVKTSIFFAALFYLLIGVSGYFYAFDHICTEKSPITCTDGVPQNLLNVFNFGEKIVDLGRFALLCNLLFSLPLVMLPCRAIFVSYTSQFNILPRPKTESDLEEALIDGQENEPSTGFDYIHVVSTVVLLVSAQAIMIFGPGAALIMNFIGSTFVLFAGLCLPLLIYIKIEEQLEEKSRLYHVCKVGFYVSLILLIACIYESILRNTN